MGQGIEIFDASGNSVFASATRLGRIIGFQTVGGSPYSGSYSLGGAESYGDVWWTVYDSTALANPFYGGLQVYISSGSIYWATDPALVGDKQYSLIYGTF